MLISSGTQEEKKTTQKTHPKTKQKDKPKQKRKIISGKYSEAICKLLLFVMLRKRMHSAHQIL